MRALPEQMRLSSHWMCASAEVLVPLRCKIVRFAAEGGQDPNVDTGTSCSKTTMIVAKCVESSLVDASAWTREKQEPALFYSER